jgi:Fur family ferric uptake transcriptional regulator
MVTVNESQHQHGHSHTHGRSDIAVDARSNDLAERLRERGLRLTPQRVQVLEAVRQLQHATPEQVHETLPDVDLVTVYRTVELLEELDLIRHTHLSHGAASYRPAEDDHVHVICHNCGVVLNAPQDLIDTLARRLLGDDGFVVDRSHLTVFGSCRHCVGSAVGNKTGHADDTD